MSYERLELTDFVDNWDAAKVKHLEDGIVANAEAIERYHNDSVVEMQADWNQNDETAKDYIKNRPFYVEHSAAEPCEPIYHPIDEEFIPDTIARVTDIPVIDTTLTSEGATADAKTVGSVITGLTDDLEALEDKVDNKQIEDYFKSEEKYTILFEGIAADGDDVIKDISLPDGVKFNRPLKLKIVSSEGTEQYINESNFSSLVDEYGNLKAASLGIDWEDENNIIIGISITSYKDESQNDRINTIIFNYGSFNNKPFTIYQAEIVNKTLDEKYIDNNIARTADIPAVDSTLSIDGAAADAKAVGEAISNLENKVGNKQVEEYFNIYEEELYVSSFIEMAAGALGNCLNELKRPIHLKFVNTLTGETQIVKESDLIITYEGPPEGPTYEVITYNNTNGLIVQHFTITYPSFALFNYYGQCDDIVVYGLIPVDGKKELNEKYIPDTIARAPKATLDYVTDTPTAEQYNALLDVLKQAGILI